MHHLRLIGAALTTIFVLGTVMAVSALALPTLLPETITSFTGKKAGSSEIEELKANGETIDCTEDVSSNDTVEANHHLGLYHEHLSGCTAASKLLTCTGLGESSGVILELGSWHLVYDSLAPNLSNDPVAFLFLVDTIHFECGGRLFIIPLGGMQLCLILNPTALTRVFEMHCNKAASANRPEETKYYNEAGALVGIGALTESENEGTAEGDALVGLYTLTLPAAALIMT
jgi:hypothetical protein